MSQKSTTAQQLATLDMLLVASLWQQVNYGHPPYTPNLSHVGGVYTATREGFDAALNVYSHIAKEMEQAGITRDQAWAAVPALAPWATVEIIQIVGGSGWHPGIVIDYTGSGA